VKIWLSTRKLDGWPLPFLPSCAAQAQIRVLRVVLRQIYPYWKRKTFDILEQIFFYFFIPRAAVCRTDWRLSWALFIAGKWKKEFVFLHHSGISYNIKERWKKCNYISTTVVFFEDIFAADEATIFGTLKYYTPINIKRDLGFCT
jgi:hypothetical protein